MNPMFCTPADVQARLEFEMSADLQRICTTAIEDLSLDALDAAQEVGQVAWTSASVPPIVRSIVARACARFIRDPDGYTRSTANDEAVAWSPGQKHIGAVLLPEERKKIQGASRGGSVFTMGSYANSPQTTSDVCEYVYVEGLAGRRIRW